MTAYDKLTRETLKVKDELLRYDASHQLTLMPGLSRSGLMRVFAALVSLRAALYAYFPP